MENANSTKAKPERSGLNSGLDVLEFMARRPAVHLTDIANGLGRSKSGIHSVLATLTERGYAQRSPQGLYRLGIRAWEIGRASGPTDIATVSAPFLNRLAAEVNEAVILGILTGFDVLYLHVVESSQAVRLHVEVGERIPANCTSTGISLLATLADEAIASLAPVPMVRPTERTVTELDALIAEVEATRKRGYAKAIGVWHPDVAGVATAIRDEAGQAIAGLCVSAPLYRVDEAWYGRVVPALLRTSADIAEAFAVQANHAPVAAAQ